MPQLSPLLKSCTDVDLVWLLSLSRAFFIAAFSASSFLFLAFLARWTVTSNAGCIFSAIVTKWTSSPATPYFFRAVWWIFPASVKRNSARSEEGGTEWDKKTSDQSVLFGPDGRDWSAFFQTFSCQRGPIIFIPFSEHIIYWLLSGYQDHFTQYNKMCFWTTLQTLTLT